MKPYIEKVYYWTDSAWLSRELSSLKTFVSDGNGDIRRLMEFNVFMYLQRKYHMELIPRI